MIHDHVMLDGSLLDAALEETFDQMLAFVVDAEEDSPSNEQIGLTGSSALQPDEPSVESTKARRNFNLWLN